MTRLAPILLLVACTRLPSPAYHPTTADDQARIEAVRTAWDARGDLPTTRTPACDDAVLHLRVAVVDDAGLTRWCGKCPPGSCPGFRPSNVCPWGCAAGCYLERREWRVIVQHESIGPAPSLHELGHLFAACALGYADAAHSDVRLWGKGGVVAEARHE